MVEGSVGIAVPARLLQLGLQLECLVPADRKLVVEGLHKKDSVADKRPLNGLVQGELRKIAGIGGSRDRPPLSGMPFVDRTYLTRDDRSKETGRLL